jgi:hypothetical protein
MKSAFASPRVPSPAPRYRPRVGPPGRRGRAIVPPPRGPTDRRRAA